MNKNRFLLKVLFFVFLFCNNEFFISKVSAIGFYKNGYPKAEDRYINDFAQIISPIDKKNIYTLLRGMDMKKGTEVTVVTIDSIRDYIVKEKNNFESFVTTLFNTWGIGDKERNDGIMILVSVKDRQVQIEFGKGYANKKEVFVEGKNIIDNVMIPYFKQNLYSKGIVNGVSAVVRDILDPSFCKKIGKFISNHKGKIILSAALITAICSAVIIYFIKNKKRNSNCDIENGSDSISCEDDYEESNENRKKSNRNSEVFTSSDLHSKKWFKKQEKKRRKNLQKVLERPRNVIIQENYHSHHCCRRCLNENRHLFPYCALPFITPGTCRHCRRRLTLYDRPNDIFGNQQTIYTPPVYVTTPVRPSTSFSFRPTTYSSVSFGGGTSSGGYNSSGSW